jgi:hypothetical protein
MGYQRCTHLFGVPMAASPISFYVVEKSNGLDRKTGIPSTVYLINVRYGSTAAIS